MSPLFLEHKGAYRLIKGEVPDEDYTVPLGKAAIAREGKDMTAIAYGMMLHHCLKAAEAIAADGVEVEVVDVRTISPLDRETIVNSVKKTGKAIVVYEDTYSGGWGAEISASIAEEAFAYLDGPIVRVAGPDVPAMPYNHNQEAYFMPNPEKILKAMKELAAY